MNDRRPKSSHLRLVVPSEAHARRAWLAEAARHAAEFMVRQGHRLSDPSLASWVLEQCAELVLERAVAAHASWAALPIEELWRRLDNLQRFFPQPRLIVAHHETLCAFLPWLCTEGRLEVSCAEEMLARLDEVSAPALAPALAQLAARAARITAPSWET